MTAAHDRDGRDDVFDIEDFFRPRPQKCVTCGGAYQAPQPGNCPECIEAQDRKRIDRHERDVETIFPSRYRWARFGAAELEQRVSLPSLRRVAALHEQSIVLRGAPGTGKTSLACAMVRAWWRSRIEPRVRAGCSPDPRDFLAFVDCTAAASVRKTCPLGREPELIVAAKSAAVCILDDLDYAAGSDVITEIVHARHNDERPTLVTTSMTPQEISERFPGGTARRLTDGVLWLELGSK